MIKLETLLYYIWLSKNLSLNWDCLLWAIQNLVYFKPLENFLPLIVINRKLMPNHSFARHNPQLVTKVVPGTEGHLTSLLVEREHHNVHGAHEFVS